MLHLGCLGPCTSMYIMSHLAVSLHLLVIGVAYIAMSHRSQQHSLRRTSIVPTAHARDAKAQAATSSSATSVEWERNSSQTPIDQLPEAEGDWSLPFIGETPEFKADHWEWARKR